MSNCFENAALAVVAVCQGVDIDDTSDTLKGKANAVIIKGTQPY